MAGRYHNDETTIPGRGGLRSLYLGHSSIHGCNGKDWIAKTDETHEFHNVCCSLRPKRPPSQLPEARTWRRVEEPPSPGPRQSVMAAVNAPRSSRGTRTQHWLPWTLRMSTGIPAPVAPRNCVRAAVQ